MIYEKNAKERFTNALIVTKPSPERIVSNCILWTYTWRLLRPLYVHCVGKSLRRKGISLYIRESILVISLSNAKFVINLSGCLATGEIMSEDTTKQSIFTSFIFDRPYECDHCQKSYFRRYLLTNHIKTHHPASINIRTPSMHIMHSRGFQTENLNLR